MNDGYLTGMQQPLNAQSWLVEHRGVWYNDLR